jgi:hypothetical protein
MAPSFAMPNPTPAALIPALDADAVLPLRAAWVDGTILAAYNPAQLDRPSAWALLGEIVNRVLRDVTPAVTA